MVGNQKYITIATDAGVWADHGISVWACYIVAPGGVLQLCQPFKEHIGESYIAETYALRNALHVVDRQFDLAQYKVIVYGEVEVTLRAVTTKAGNVKKRDLERSYIVDEMLAILAKSQGWEWRHVKAHTAPAKARKQNGGDMPAKFKLNRWCDQACRALGKRLVREQRAAAKALAEQQSAETPEGV